MAVVGEARIIVKAITDGVGDEISRALKSAQNDVDKDGARLGRTLNKGFMRGFGKSTKKGGIFGDLFDLNQAEAARQAFAKLQRSGLTLQVGLSVLTGSIFTLVGAIGSLIGSAGAAAPSLMALVSSMVSLKVGMGLAGFALGGVTNAMNSMGSAGGGLQKTVAELREEMQQLRFEAEEAALSEKEAALNLEKARENLARVQDLPPNSMARREAELAFEQADLAYRRAKDRAADLNEEIAKGPQQAAGGGADPYAGLTKSQKKFAQFLVSIKPKIDELKEAVASGFLPILETQIDRVIKKTFPTFKAGFKAVGVALGSFSKSLADALIKADNAGTLEKVFDSIATSVSQIGVILGNAFGSFLILMEAAAPLTEQFLNWIIEITDNFKKFLEEANGNGSLERFFIHAGEIAADFGDIFGDIFQGLGALIEDSFAPGSGGDMLLQWLKTAFDGFAEIGSDKAGLRTYLQNTAANTIALLQAIGGLIGQFLDVAASPQLKVFFDTLTAGAPSVEKILEAGLEAAPALADLILAVADIAAILGDAAAPKAFFETLADIVRGIADFLSQKEVKAFLDAVAPIAAQFLAIGFILNKLKLPFQALLGLANMVVTPFGAIFGFFRNTKGISQFGILIGKVKGVFETFVLRMMYFKDGVIKVFGVLKTFGGTVLGLFKTMGTFIFGILTKIGMAIRVAFAANPLGFIITAISLVVSALVWFFTQTEVGKEMWANFTRFISEAWTNFAAGFMAVWDGVMTFFSEAWTNIVTFFTNGWNAFVGFFQTAIGRIGGFFAAVWAGIGTVFRNVINGYIGLFEGFVNFIIGGVNNIIRAINSIRFTVPDWVPLIGGRSIGFNVPLIPRIAIPRLAEGGVVAPSMGGTMAIVAEAGRPERIEPLDENGLSKRDKAMIQYLSGGAAGGINIVVNASPGMDENELAAIISRRLSRELRRGATA